jgi:hypothetical protein
MGALLALLPVFQGIFKNLFPDPVAQTQANAQLQQVINQLKEDESNNEAADRQSANSVIIAESAQGWLGQWHSACMWFCMILIGCSWIYSLIFVNLFHAFGITLSAMPVPIEAWNFLNIALGGSAVLHKVNQIVDTHGKNKYQGSSLQKDLSGLASKATSSVEKMMLNKVVADAEQLG